MKTINLNLSDEKSIFTTLKNDIGGELKNFSQETEFKVDREFGKGTIRGIELENGITFLEFDLVCNEDLSIVVENKVRSNVNFVYCTKGMLQHSFGNSDKTYKIEAFQTSILSNIESTSNTLYFKKDVNIQSTLISVNTTYQSQSESIIHSNIKDLFISNKTDDYFYCGSYNFKISDTIAQLSAIKNEGVVRTLLISGLVNVILALEIEQHKIDVENSDLLSTSLTRTELGLIKELTEYIQSSYDSNLQITELTSRVGLSAAKLQEGFKLMHGVTVCEYIKSVRLTKAEELISRTDLNISEIVYSLGFTSRSYFSKIFKERYNCCPTTYKKKNRLVAISA